MKVFIILATIALTHGAKLERTYLPPSHAGTSGGGNFLQTPIGKTGFSAQSGPSNPGSFPQTYSQSESYNQGSFQTGSIPDFETNNYNVNYNTESRPERAQAALERNAAILRQDNSNDGESFSYTYETENGIYAEESGVATNGVEAQGGYSYTGDDGQVYSVRYTADQNGFVPQGDHLPTPPPVPEEILKALEQNARDEAAGIYDDGSYNEGKYESNANVQTNYQQSSQQNYANDDTIVTNAAFRSGNYPNAALETPVSGPSSISGSSVPSGPFGSSPFARGSGSSGSVEKAYLPPFAAQANAFGRRQTFDSRNGYRY